jgi:nucleotide-binding universal stress UspA family protein
MKTLLLPIVGDEHLTGRVQATCSLARWLGAHITCLQVTPFAAYAMGEPAIGGFGMTALVEAVEADRQKLKTEVEQLLRPAGVAWDWETADGDPGDWVAEASRLADLIVMSGGPWKHAAGEHVALVGQVAIAAPAPLLLLPPSVTEVSLDGGALVAWDGSQESAQALRLGLPLLARARSVTLLTVTEKTGGADATEAALWLSRHGLKAEVVERGRNGEPIDAIIRAEAAARGCGWVAMGAYGHSRVRETLFGGVTRSLISAPPLPLLLAH